MSTDAKIILRYLGLMIHVPGVMALVCWPLCYGLGEPEASWGFVATALSSLGVGQLLFRRFQAEEEARLHHAMVIAALGWVIVPLLGSLPFMVVAREVSSRGGAPVTVQAFVQPWNALFESFSGFTGTGLTMAIHPSQLPRSLQWWRSFTQWVGGGGVILLMLSILSHTKSAYSLYYSEGRSKRILPSVVSTVRTIWWIYLLFTSLSVLICRGVGMSWWEALNHGMTGIATGGFSVTDRSIGAYGADVRLAVMLIMVLGTVSFAVHYEVLTTGRISAFWRDTQHRMLWATLGLGSGLLVLENLWWSGTLAWVDSAFQWVSALATAGFQTADLRLWSPTGQLLLSLAMILGGAAGSTAGGLKQIRVALVGKGLAWHVQDIRRRPHEMRHYELDGAALEEPEALRMVQSAGTLSALWAVVLWIGVFVLIHFVPKRFGLSEVIFEVASAQGNVGLSTGITHPSLPWPAKLTLMLSMWMGRLEIVPTLILIMSILHRLLPPRRRGKAAEG